VRKIPLCVFAKPPKPGYAKTRLAAKIGNEAACELATAFINDFLSYAKQFEWGVPVLATTEVGMPAGAFPADAFPKDVDPQSIARWLQPSGDLGAKIEGIVREALKKADAAICLGADSPGRPPSRLLAVRDALQSGSDAVLGPTADGGYDILALKRCPAGLLADLPWSQPTTFAASKQRFEQRGLKVTVLDTWWDVDEVEDLDLLDELLQKDASRAPATAAAMAKVKADGRWSPQGAGWQCVQQ